ncbi:MAG: sulfurtransferase, partial [Sedimenticola sp.]
PKHIIPGHGHATTLERAKADTYDYLIFLRQEIGKLIENDGDVLEAVKIDQSRFSYLEVFEQIAGRNAQAVFTQMEFE